MALINLISNTARVVFNGIPIVSLPVETLLLLGPAILKTVDKLTAFIGDTLTYTIVITNVSLSTITNLPFSDAVPEGTTYVAGSFEVNGSVVEPTITDDTLEYTIPSIGIARIVTIQFQVEVVGGEDSLL